MRRCECEKPERFTWRDARDALACSAVFFVVLAACLALPFVIGALAGAPL